MCVVRKRAGVVILVRENIFHIREQTCRTFFVRYRERAANLFAFPI